MRGFLATLIVSLATAAASEDAPQAKKPRTDFYTFFDLLNKAERIVVADVGPAKDGAAALIVRETLKAPASDARYVPPERLKHAADLLANDKQEYSPQPKAAAPAIPVRVAAEHLPLPREGTQAIFFLWDKAPGGGADEAVYKLAHPQCVYDVELLAQVKAGAQRPRSVADGRYLRDWDREMAARARRRQADEELMRLKVGAVVFDLRIRAERATRALRADNSFAVTAVLANTGKRPQQIYDGPAGGYGVILRPANSDAGIVFRPSTRNAVADSSVLNIADITDFATVHGNREVSKELFFDAKDIPALSQLDGDYSLSIFFSTAQDGRGLDLDTRAWVGTIVSEPVPLRFEARAQSRK